MDESILESVKNSLGITSEYRYFDSQIIMHINSVFTILHQLGVGPDPEFSINDESATWSDFFGNAKPRQIIKSYMYLRVRMLFDPPTNSFLMDSMKQQIQEYEWRLNVAVDPEA